MKLDTRMKSVIWLIIQFSMSIQKPYCPTGIKLFFASCVRHFGSLVWEIRAMNSQILHIGFLIMHFCQLKVCNKKSTSWNCTVFGFQHRANNVRFHWTTVSKPNTSFKVKELFEQFVAYYSCCKRVFTWDVSLIIYAILISRMLLLYVWRHFGRRFFSWNNCLLLNY